MVWIDPDDLRFIFGPIRQGDGDGIRAVNDMVVGDDVPLPAPHEPGPGSLGHFEHIGRPAIASPVRRRQWSPVPPDSVPSRRLTAPQGNRSPHRRPRAGPTAN